MDVESIISEITQRQIPYDFTHTWNLKNKTNEQKMGQTRKQTLNYREQIDGYQSGGGWGMGEISRGN